MNQSPDFIIIGAMKCATSSLHEQLARQAGIFMTDLKEPNFFSNDEEYVKGMDWYLSHFQSAPPNALCGESSTHYTKLPTYPHTVERIEQHFPDLKFIYVMRHPIDRLVSQYIHEWSQGVIATEIEQAIAEFPEMIYYSEYSRQLQPYFEAFGQEQVLPVFFERMLTEPQAELERVCRFIGYPKQPVWNLELEAQNISRERMRKSAWRDFLVEFPGLKQIRRWFIPKSFRKQVRSLWTMKNKPELKPEKIAQLKQIFDRDLDILGSWLDTKLTCDNFKKKVTAQPLEWVKK